MQLNDLWWNLDAKKQETQYKNCASFIVMLQSLPKEVRNAAEFPNKEKAPWHVQFNFGSHGVINVWPHKRTFQVAGDAQIKDNAQWDNLNSVVRVVAARHYAQTGKYRHA